MKKKSLKKLRLERETLVSLKAGSLGVVLGAGFDFAAGTTKDETCETCRDCDPDTGVRINDEIA